MYDSIEAAFLSSESEVAPLIKGECFLTGTTFYGNNNTSGGDEPFPKSQVLEKWKQALDL